MKLRLGDSAEKEGKINMKSVRMEDNWIMFQDLNIYD